MKQLYYVGVIGAADCGEEILMLAEQVGAAVAECNSVLVCGGRGGVMEAAARGARNSGGVAIGILPGNDPREGNKFLTYSIATGLGDARNAVIARTSDVLIAVAGGYGTLSEIGLALKMGKPVIALKSWDCREHTGKQAGVEKADSVADVKHLLAHFRNK